MKKLTHLFILSFSAALQAQPGTGENGAWTTQDDHRHMLQQLGITALRPGPSGQPDAPDAANTDEALANRYPDWPELLRLDNGQAVTTAEQWWQQRRPQLVEIFEREVVGRVPANVPAVQWSVSETATGTLAGKPVEGRQYLGHVDNSAHPDISVDIAMSVVLPADAEGPVPLMVMFRGSNLQQAVGNEAPPRFGPPPDPNLPQDPSPGEQLIAAGWGFAWLNPGSIQADNGAGLRSGIIGLVNKGEPCAPGPGARRARSTCSKRTRPSTQAASVSKAFPATARRRWSPSPLNRALPWA